MPAWPASPAGRRRRRPARPRPAADRRGHAGDRRRSAGASRRPRRRRRHPGWLVFRGIVAVVFGVVALAMPLVTLGSLVLVFSAYLLADGVLALIAAVRAARHRHGWGGWALEGIADLLLGAIALLWPGLTLLALVTLSGSWAIVSGGCMAYGASRAGDDARRMASA